MAVGLPPEAVPTVKWVEDRVMGYSSGLTGALCPTLHQESDSPNIPEENSLQAREYPFEYPTEGQTFLKMPVYKAAPTFKAG